MKIFKLLLISALSLLYISSYSQDSNFNKKSKQDTLESEKYSCPMHPGVKSGKPGTCPKCGMNLTAPKKEGMKMAYCCPMHADVKSDKAGTCPKCGMGLKKTKQN
jgi:Cu+-exporting ATPase